MMLTIALTITMLGTLTTALLYLLGVSLHSAFGGLGGLLGISLLLANAALLFIWLNSQGTLSAESRWLEKVLSISIMLPIGCSLFATLVLAARLYKLQVTR